MQCIDFSTLQLVVIFVIPATPTFGECEVTHLGFLCCGSQHRDLCVFGAGMGNWDFSRGFGGMGRWSHESHSLLMPCTFPTLSEHSRMPGRVTGTRIGALVPPVPSLCSSLPPRRITGSSSAGGNCVTLFYFFSMRKPKKPEAWDFGAFRDFFFFPADEETVALCPSRRAGWM